MKVQILGPGCSKCELLARHVVDAAAELNIECNIEKITDIDEITKLGVMITPGLVINGKVVSSGRVLSTTAIKTILAEQLDK